MALRSLLICGVWLLTACGGSQAPAPATPGSPTVPSPAAPAGPPSFRFAPVDPAVLQYIVPLGSMNPWGHTLPTDHLYFAHHFNTGPFAPVTIVAPASGTVESVIERGGDAKITVRVTSQFIYAIDHVNLKAGFGSGVTVQGGTELGTSTSGIFDFGLSFFYGRRVFAAIEGQTTPAGAGPYVAY